MDNNYHNIFRSYSNIIEKTISNNQLDIDKIDTLKELIRNHIDKLDRRVFNKRDNLMIAIRLVECFRILDWIKVCVFCGSYETVYRELRYMIDAITQAFFIDITILSGTLKAKSEAYKAFEDLSNFMGQKLLNKIQNMPGSGRLGELYKTLSNYVHSSYIQYTEFLDKAKKKDSWDIMKENIYNEENLKKCIEICKEIIEIFIKINKRFEEIFLKCLINNSSL